MVMEMETATPTLQTGLLGLQTGDVLLYRTNDLGATFNACAQNSPWSHVALVVRGQPDVMTRMYADDYSGGYLGLEPGLALLEAVPRRGVSLFPLLPRLARIINAIHVVAVRRRTGPAVSSQHQAGLTSFIDKTRGRKLEVMSSEMLRAWLPCVTNSAEGWSAFFCSELVAEGLQQVGVLREVGVNSNNLLPSSFASSSAAQPHSLDGLCLPGHGYGAEERPRPSMTPSITCHGLPLTFHGLPSGAEERLVEAAAPAVDELRELKRQMKAYALAEASRLMSC